MSEYTDFYVGLFSTMERCEKKYGCAEKELEAWAESLEMETAQARKLFRETEYTTRQEVALSDAWIAAVSKENAQHVTRTEVALSDDLAASFHREAMSLSLVSEHCVILLDRAETYRLLSLLEAEFKGMVS